MRDVLAAQVPPNPTASLGVTRTGTGTKLGTGQSWFRPRHAEQAAARRVFRHDGKGQGRVRSCRVGHEQQHFGARPRAGCTPRGEALPFSCPKGLLNPPAPEEARSLHERGN